ncbi:MAG TPA: hypothetical protein PLP42_12865 [Acidobacteriota bacterium]|nr:hypothetical protein [Acidobacteriota bacterium]
MNESSKPMYVNPSNAKSEWSSSTIRAAFASMAGGLTVILGVLGFDLPEGVGEDIAGTLAGIFMILVGWFARRGRINAMQPIRRE